MNYHKHLFGFIEYLRTPKAFENPDGTMYDVCLCAMAIGACLDNLRLYGIEEYQDSLTDYLEPEQVAVLLKACRGIAQVEPRPSSEGSANPDAP